MGAEHAAVDVRLVHDDIAQVREHVSPAVVVRQEADVHHVRIREDRVRPPADLPALLARGVAVVDRRPQPRNAVGGERAELILRERLRRVQVEHAVARLARERVEHRQVERERLPRRGAGRDHHVLAARSRVPRLALVDVELRDADRVAHARVEPLRQRRGARLARGLVAQVGELLALEQALPAYDVDAHQRSVPRGSGDVARAVRADGRRGGDRRETVRALAGVVV